MIQRRGCPLDELCSTCEHSRLLTERAGEGYYSCRLSTYKLECVNGVVACSCYERFGKELRK